MDVDQFEAAASHAKDSQDPGLFQAALALYLGDLLPDDPYEEWTIQRREALRQVYLNLLLGLARLHEARQEYPAAIEALLRLLVMDKSHEEAHAGLMRLFALSGQRQQALRQYQILREVLQAELDAEPGQPTTQLFEDIQAGRLSPAAPAAPAHRHNLPAELTSFIGRENQIDEVRQQIKEHRLVTLTGSGGTGKTRLALKASEGLLEHFPDGVFLVELAPLSDPALVPQACLQALELVHQPGVPPQAALVSYLEKKHLLLILDNCEHMISACTHLASALLKGSPGLHILATSREILSVPGEHPFSVPSMAVPDLHALSPLAELAQVEAMRLLIERAGQVLPGFCLTADNATAVAQICQRLDGIPLAIELAAARMRLMTAEQIAARLDNTFRLLTGGSKAVLPRQQTLKATIDWSYDLLTPKERLLLQRLSVFAGGWTLEAAEAVCAEEIDASARPEEQLDQIETMDLLTNLVDKSLVMVSIQKNGARYSLLETIRQYVRDRLVDTGRGMEVRSRHLVYFAHLSGEAEPHLRGKGQIEWLERLDQELDNLRTALEWSFSNRIELGLKIAADLMWFWHTRALFEEEIEWLKKLLAAEVQQRGMQPLVGERALQRARGLRTYAYHSAREYVLNGITEAEQLAIFQDSVAILRLMGPAACRELGISLYHVFVWETILFQPSPIHEEMLDILHRENEKFYLSEYLFIMANFTEDLDQAINIENSSLAISREIEDLDGISSRSAHLGYLMMYKGDYFQAGLLFQEALDISRKVKNHWYEAAMHSALSTLAMVQENYEEAIQRAEEALKKYRELNFMANIAGPLATLQQIAWSQGKFGESIQYAQEIIQSILENQFNKNRSYLYLGRVAISQGDITQAEVYLRQVIPPNDWRETTEWRKQITQHLLGWIALFRQQSKYPASARLIGTVDSIYQQIAAGLIPRERSEYEEDDAAARAALGDDAFTAAFTEGRALTLEQAVHWLFSETQVDGE